MPVKDKPPFLDGLTKPEAYERWLGRKASAQVRRDRARGGNPDIAARSLRSRCQAR